MKYLFLGIIQGLTEFLPISSSGHLVILKHWMNLQEEGVVMEVTLHFATLLAIIIFFRKKILEYFTKEKFPLIVIGTLPIAIIGVLFKNEIQSLFSNYLLVITTLSLTGIILFLSKNSKENKDKLDLKMAFFIGFAQAVALTPGISRSGITVASALLLGLKRKKAFEFSFILAIPALLGAFIINLPEVCGTKIGTLNLIMGGIPAFFSGLLALWIFYKTVRNKDLYLFSYYLWLAAAVSLLLFLLFQTH
jgi:undecaprenyl-diphosphatase